MNIWDNDHEDICYNGRDCPACKILEDMTAFESDLTAAEAKIEMLEEKIAALESNSAA